MNRDKYISLEIDGDLRPGIDEQTQACLSLVAATFLLAVQDYTQWKRRQSRIIKATPPHFISRRKPIENPNDSDGSRADKWFRAEYCIRGGKIATSDHLPFSFIWCCNILGLSPERIRRKLQLGWVDICKNMASKNGGKKKVLVRKI